MVLMRMPLTLSMILLFLTVRPDTVSDEVTDEPPMEPMEMPWPPLHVLELKTVLVLDCMARQSSWL